MNLVVIVLATLSLLSSPGLVAADAPGFQSVASVFQKYCNGCHSVDEREGGLSLASFAELLQGGENGPVLIPRDGGSSRLVKLMLGQQDPVMPPEGEPRPSSDEIELVRSWIDAGALGSSESKAPSESKGPSEGQGPSESQAASRDPRSSPIAAVPGVRDAITAVASSPVTELLAVGRFGRVDLFDAVERDLVFAISGLGQKVNSLSFSQDGSLLVLASGAVGVTGEATIWNLVEREVVRVFRGHSDAIHDALLSPDSRTLATCSYDHRIILWDVRTGSQIRTLEGHNDAVYDLAFSPDGSVLASASGDETVKLWNVESGQRLDTLGQPEAEQYAVAFSPNGRFVLAGGADNRIRVWRFLSKSRRRINPLVHSRFAHEGSVVCLVFSPDGRTLVSAGEDRTIKQWETRRYTEVHLFQPQPDVISGMTFGASGGKIIAGRMNGSMKTYPLATIAAAPAADRSAVVRHDSPATKRDPPDQLDEVEPNDSPDTAMRVTLPVEVEGAILSSSDVQQQDADLFRFTAKAGEQWVLEINGARRKSPIDSKVEVLDSTGGSIPRILLQATRDSYFTFRGQNSDTSDGFRLHNWREMELNQYVYCRGEVVRLWHYPRGPDSGFRVYPGRGKRHSFFDTSALAHALNEPCYIVEPHPPGSSIIPNGLPVFTLLYENDDESLRRWGTDSKLTFTTPSDGEYLARVTDVRGFAGEDYRYSLTIRQRRPDFQVKLAGANPAVSPGSGKEFSVTAERIDGYEGEIRVEIDGLPPGFRVTSPLIIEPGQEVAYGTIHALPDAPQPTKQNAKKTRVVAKAVVAGRTVERSVSNLGAIKLDAPSKLLVHLLEANQSTSESVGATVRRDGDQPLELTMAPGETISAFVRVERNGFDGRVVFGKDDSGRNLPHGVYVDNIGLNGLMIVEGQNERRFFLTAAPWVNETTRTFHLVAQAAGNQASWPVILHIRQPDRVANTSESLRRP